jgi:glutathione S-transferase
LPYRLETLAQTSLKSPEYLKVHPLGKIPAIRDDDLTMFESGAILEYILEQYGDGRLAPAPRTPGRAEFLQWVQFAEATALPPIAHFIDHTFFRPEAERVPAVVAYSRTKAAAVLGMLEHERMVGVQDR